MAQNIQESGSIPLTNTNGQSPSNIKQINQSSKSKKKRIPKKRKFLLIIPQDIYHFSNHGIYEAIKIDNQPFFLRCSNSFENDNNSKLFSIETAVHLADELPNGKQLKTIILPNDSQLEALPFDLQNKEYLHEKTAIIPTTQELFDRIVSMICTYVDIPADWTKVCALMVLLTYEQHKFNWVAYLGVFGDTGTGKSVLTELMSQLSYRGGYFTQENGADIYQFLTEYEGTIPCLAEDEIQGLEKDTDKVKIYKSGNSKSGKTSRIIGNDNRRKLKVFPTYCFKILSGEQVPTVKGLNERTLLLNMSKGKANKSWYDRSIEDIDKIKELKWDLLKWRMLNYNNYYPTDQQSTSRIENNLRPLRAIAKGLPFEQDFENWCNDAIQRSQDEKKATLEGSVVDAVYSLIKKGLFETEPVIQGQEVTKVYLGFDSLWEKLKAITYATSDGYNDKLVTNDFGEISKNKVGRVLTDIFGSKSITRTSSDKSSKESKIRCRVFEVATLIRVVSNYFDEEETESLKQKIQQETKKPNDNNTNEKAQ